MAELRSLPALLLITLTMAVFAACVEADGGSNDAAVMPAATRVVQSAPSPGAPLAVRTIGLDSLTMAAVVRRAEALPRLRTLIVARHGDVLLERRFRGPALDAPANVKSVSKSVLSAAIGLAIEDSILGGVDQPIARYFEQHIPATEDPRKRAITIGHLLSMQSGLERTSGAFYGRWVTSPNWVRYAITRPMVAEPGGPRLYSTGNSHLLSAILTQASGRSTWHYMRERLAEPAGMTLPRWPADPQGIFFGGNEMRLAPRDMLRFGELYRNGGRVDGVQVVPEHWVRASLTPRAGARRGGESYGYGWFLGNVNGFPMFYAWGFGGQFIFVVPDLELTVVTTSDPDVAREGEHLRAIRTLLREGIVPAAVLGAGAVTDSA